MFDIFYSGTRPNLFAHEQPARDIEHARTLSRTRYFWWTNYLTDYTDFDFLFEPVPWESEYTHAWPSQHHEYSGTFLVPRNNTRIQYRFHKKIIPNRDNRSNYNKIKDNIEFDYTWAPHPFDPPYRYIFGNQWYPANRMPTVEYCMPGATEIKYVFTPRAELVSNKDNNWRTLTACEFDYSWIPDPGDPPYIYVFGNQWWPATKMPTVKYHVPGATEIKYMPYPRAELKDNRANWSVPDNVDVTTFDFSWRPDPGDPPYIYQFGTQHQRTGGPQYHVKDATETKYIDQIRIRTERVATAIYEIDHLDGAAGQIAGVFRTVRYFDNYLDTLKRIAKNAPDDQEFIWICSSICDYKDFDFTWHPEVWQAAMLHVFASDGEKFGDTFFMHVPTFRYRADKLQLLDWYDINYMDKNVPRRPVPVIKHNYDTHVEAVKQLDFNGPLAIFTTEDNPDYNIPAVPLWREKTKTVVPLSKGASSVIIPKSAVSQINTQIYDYPWIDKTHTTNPESPLDIVFLSNGESNAETNWEHLKKCVPPHHRLHRIDGINGRVKSEQAAANISSTSFYFRVPAKLKVEQNFDWNWQPDRLQQSKNYIFYAVNPVNNLEYGHMAIVAFNRALTLSTQGIELDFSMESLHEVVPLRSGIAMFAEDPWTAWRTAFRECIKLKYSLPDVENEYRLKQWLTQDNTQGKWSRQGAEDAVEYYDSVAGDFTELRKSYDWDWLSSYAVLKRNLMHE